MHNGRYRNGYPYGRVLVLAQAEKARFRRITGTLPACEQGNG